MPATNTNSMGRNSKKSNETSDGKSESASAKQYAVIQSLPLREIKRKRSVPQMVPKMKQKKKLILNTAFLHLCCDILITLP